MDRVWYILRLKVVEKRMAKRGVSFYQPEVALPLSAIKHDLTRSIVITILALTLQFALAFYLARGGWQKVLPMMDRIVVERR